MFRMVIVMSIGEALAITNVPLGWKMQTTFDSPPRLTLLAKLVGI